MTTKDYVYLGLLVLASLVFYCHGFYAGISRSARIYDALLKEENDAIETPIIAGGEEEAEIDPPGLAEPLSPPRRSDSSLPTFRRRELRGDFGNN